MIHIVCWQLRSKRKETALLARLPDFGLKRIARSAAAGELSAEDASELKERLEPAARSKADSILVFRLCGSCQRAFLEANPHASRFNLSEFDRDFLFH